MLKVVKVEHINPFLKATIDTFKSMIDTDIKPGKVTLYEHNKIQSDISGIIGLSGGAKGSVIISFPRITALKVVSGFIGMKVVTIDDSVADAVGELANIIAGAAKKDLTQFKISISLPTVVKGEGHELMPPSDVSPLVVPFESKQGNFCLIVSFKSEI